MNAPQVQDTQKTTRFFLPRWLAFAFGLTCGPVLLTLVHGVLPWAHSLLGPRYGWAQDGPGIWNRLALILVALGFAGVIWGGFQHFARAEKRVEFEWTPKYLLSRGLYRFTRNPMYLAAVLLWLGWAFFYGSVAVFIGCALVWAVTNFVIIPREERSLQARFGESYREYKRTVPRWLGRIRR